MAKDTMSTKSQICERMNSVLSKSPPRMLRRLTWLEGLGSSSLADALIF